MKQNKEEWVRVRLPRSLKEDTKEYLENHNVSEEIREILNEMVDMKKNKFSDALHCNYCNKDMKRLRDMMLLPPISNVRFFVCRKCFRELSTKPLNIDDYNYRKGEDYEPTEKEYKEVKRAMIHSLITMSYKEKPKTDKKGFYPISNDAVVYNIISNESISPTLVEIHLRLVEHYPNMFKLGKGKIVGEECDLEKFGEMFNSIIKKSEWEILLERNERTDMQFKRLIKDTKLQN